MRYRTLSFLRVVPVCIIFIYVGIRIPHNHITSWIEGILALVGIVVAFISFAPLSKTAEYLKTIKHILAESGNNVDCLMRHEPLELYIGMMAHLYSTDGGGDGIKDFCDKWIRIGNAITSSDNHMLLSASREMSDRLLTQIASHGDKNAINRFLLFLAFVGALDEHVMNDLSMHLIGIGCGVLKEDEALRMKFVGCMKYFPESAGKKAIVLYLGGH